MKPFLCKVRCFLQEIGYARAVTALSQRGYFAEAKNLMLSKERTKCC